MTSKSLFFKLLRENAKRRLWTFALFALIFFFIFPVFTALTISAELPPEVMKDAAEFLTARERVAEDLVQMMSHEGLFLCFVMTLLAVIAGISGFSFLHSRKQTDFYHSLPVRREMLFSVSFVNGILAAAVPYLIFMAAAALLIRVKTGVPLPWGVLMEGFLFHLSFYILVYGFVVLAAVMTGNTLVSILGTLVFFFWGPGVIGLREGFRELYYLTMYHDNEKTVQLLKNSSPVFKYFMSSGSDNAGAVIPAAAAAAAVVFGISLFLYKKRPSEAAGRAMAFPVSCPIIKFLLAVPVSLAVSLFLNSMMNSDGWSVFGLVSGLLISYAMIEIIYSFDFRKMFAHRLQLLACAAAAFAVFGYYRLDMSGFDSYLPAENKILSAAVYSDEESETCYNYAVQAHLEEGGRGSHYVYEVYPRPHEITEKMVLTDVQDVLSVASCGIREAQEQRKSRRGRYDYPGDSFEDRRMMGTVLVEYRMKSGKTVRRSYYMNLLDIREEMERMFELPEYKEAIYPILSPDAEAAAAVNYSECGEYRHVPEADPEKLLSVYRKELLSLSQKERMEENPLGMIQFKTGEMQQMIDILRKEGGNYLVFNQFGYYPVYPSFKETRKLLSSYGVEAGNCMKERRISHAEISYGKEWEGRYENRTLRVDDPAQLSEVLEHASYAYGSRFNPLFTSMEVRVYPEEEESAEPERMESEYPDTQTTEPGAACETCTLFFETDEVPEFVRDEFKLTEEDIRSGSFYYLGNY